MSSDEFDRIYANVPVEQRQRLLAFRAGHPAKVLKVDGKRWSYLSSGQGEKALLFLAGAFLRADMWFYVISELEKDYRILAPDTNMFIGLSPFQTLDAIPRLMDAEGVSKASFIGLSAGGGMAQMLLQRYPERVEDLVLSHTGIIEMRPGMEAQTRRLIRLVKIMPTALVRRILLKRTSGTLPVGSPWLDFHNAYFRQSSAVITKKMVVDFLQYGIVLRKDFTFEPEAVTKWQGRALILNSQDDSVTLSSLDKLRQRFPQARVHLFERGGHHTFMLYPDDYTAVLKDFFNQTD